MVLNKKNVNIQEIKHAFVIIKVGLIILCSFFLISSSNASVDRVEKQDSIRALIIGISDYEHCNDLEYADEDARDFYNLLLSGKLGKISKENIHLLVDDSATSYNIMYDEGFTWLKDNLRKDDTVIIYISGHGVINDKLKNIGDVGYLLTHESRPKYIDHNTVRMDFLLRKMHEHADSVKFMVILDVCHAGNLLNEAQSLNMLNTEIWKKNETLIMACDKQEYAFEYDSLKNSVFNYFFVLGLKGAANDKEIPESNDFQITLKELEEYTVSNVKRYVKINNKEPQTPKFASEKKNWPISYINKDYIIPKESHHIRGVIGPGFKKNTSREQEVKSNSNISDNIIKEIDKSTIPIKLENNDKYNELNNELKKTKINSREYKNIRRKLVLVLVKTAEKAIGVYLKSGAKSVVPFIQNKPSRYFKKAVELLSPSHFLYKNLRSKQYFLEALELKNEPSVPKNLIINKLNESLLEEPYASYTLNEKGNYYKNQGNFVAAKEMYENALIINKFYSNARKNLQEINRIAPDNQKAKMVLNSEYLAGVKSAPQSYETATILGNKKVDQSTSYTIKFWSGTDPDFSKIKVVRELGAIELEEIPEKNDIRLVFGKYKNKNLAKDDLTKIKKLGFPEAQIIKKSKIVNEKKYTPDSDINYIQVCSVSENNFSKDNFSMLWHLAPIKLDYAINNGQNMIRVLLQYESKNKAKKDLETVHKLGFLDAKVLKRRYNQFYEEDLSSFSFPYAVQIARVKTNDPSNFSLISRQNPIKFVKEHNSYRVLWLCKSEKEQEEVIKKLHQKGYDGVFKVKHSQKEVLTAKGLNDTPTEYNAAIKIKDKITFKIQLAASTYWYEDQFDRVKHLGKISKEFDPEKRIYYISLGEYGTKAEAERMLNKNIRSVFKDAFIIRCKNDKRIMIKPKG